MQQETRFEREARFRKNIILESARKLFIEKGYEKTSMSDIAKAAQFSRRTMYGYFASKIEILVEVFLLVFVSLDEDLCLAIQKEGKVLLKIEEYGKAYYHYFRDNPAYYNMMSLVDRAVHEEREKLSNSVKENLKNVDLKAESIFLELVEEGVKTGELREDLIVRLAKDFFLKSLYGIVHQYVQHPQFPEDYFYIELEYLIRSLKK